jgi:nucleotide-binding universal stress UspA family protein
MRANREGGARVLARLAAEYGIADSADHRSVTGDAATLIGQIAAEEAADLIVVGARSVAGCAADSKADSPSSLEARHRCRS